jgi:poly-gamma-glutamate synthesis protein (capsule biosynthesis protein)
MLTRRALLPILGAVPLHRWTDVLPPQPERVRLLLGGDVMLSRYVGQLAVARQDHAWSLRDLAAVLASADLAFVNLESPFSDGERIGKSRMVFKAEPEMIAGLELAGIDVVSTANNHARDCGPRGVEFTLDWLARHGVAAAGSGRTAEEAHAGVVVARKGVRFGFLAYTYDQSNGNHRDVDERIAVMDVARMQEDVKSLSQRADAIVVSMHAGREYQPKPDPSQVEFARAAIDAGARVVAGHHPHVAQPWERWGPGVIFYSLGNLVFDQFFRPETQRGLLAEVVFEGRHLVRADALPVEIVQTAPRLAKKPVEKTTPATASGA